MKFYYLFVLGFLLMNACRSDQEDPTFDKIQIDKSSDFLVFGSIYGECGGDCRDLYMIANGALYRDADVVTELQSTVFFKNPLPLDKYYLASTLEDIPDYISEVQFESTDFVQYIEDFDYFIYGQKNGREFELIYDAIENASPASLKDYASELQRVLNEL